MHSFVFLWTPGTLPDLMKAVTRRLKLPALLLMTLSVIFSNECRSGAQSVAPMSFMAAGLLTILNRPESRLPADFLKARKPAHWRSVRLPGECSAFEPCSFRLDKYHSAQCQPAGRCHFRGSEEGGQTLLLTGEAHIKISSAMAEYHLFPAADPLPEQDSEPSSQEQELPIRYQDRSGELFPVTSQAVLPGVVLDDDLDDTGLKIRLLVEHSRQVQAMMQQLRSQNIEPDGFIYNLKDGRLSHTLMNDIAEWLQETDVFHQGLPAQLQFSDFIEGVSDEPDEKGVPENLPYMFRWKYSRRGGPEPEFLVYDGKRWKPLDLSEEGRDSPERDESNGWALFREYMHGYLFDLLYPDDVAIPPPIRLSRVRGMNPEVPKRNNRQKNDLKDSPKDITPPDPEQKPVSSPVQTNQAGKVTSEKTVTVPSGDALLWNSGAFYQQRQMKHQDEVVANTAVSLKTFSPAIVTKSTWESRDKGNAWRCILCNELFGGMVGVIIYQTTAGRRLCAGCRDELVKAKSEEEWARLISQRQDSFVDPSNKCLLCDCNPSCSGHFSNCIKGILEDRATTKEVTVSKEDRWDHLCVCGKSFSDFYDTEHPEYLTGLEDHLQNDCPQYRIKCEYCCKPAVLKDYEEHLNGCGAYLGSPVVCLKCSQTVVVRGFDVHSRQCSSCDKPFPCLESGDHNKTCVRSCEFVWVGCYFAGTAAALKQHNGESVSYHLNLVMQEMYELHERTDKILKKLSEKVVGGAPANNPQAELDRITQRIDWLEQQHSIRESDYRNMREAVKHLQDKYSELSQVVQILRATSYDGVYTWKIAKLARRRAEAVCGKTPALHSPPFYTSRSGYKMYLRLYLNGDGCCEGKYLSYYIGLMQGQFDPLLPWPFKQVVTLSLLAQDGCSQNITQSFVSDSKGTSWQKPKVEMNVAAGCPKFCLLTYLDDLRYVRDDTIFLKAEVSLKGIEHIH